MSAEIIWFAEPRVTYPCFYHVYEIIDTPDPSPASRKWLI